MSEPAPSMPLRALLARIWRDYLSSHKGSLILSILCAATTGLLTAALLKLLEPAVNGLFLGGNQPIVLFDRFRFPADQALIVIPAAILGVAVVRTLAAIGQAALVNRLGHTIVGDIQIRLFGAMIRADLARLRSQHSGGFVSSVLFDANLVREAFTSGVVNYTQNLLTLIAVLIYMGVIDWQLTVVVLLGVPLVALVLRRFGRKTRKAAVGAMAETENLSTALMENLDGVRLIKIENREAAEQDRVAEVIARRQRHVIKGANARAFAGPSSDMVAYVVVAAVMAYAGWRAQSGEMTVGGFAAFIGLLLARVVSGAVAATIGWRAVYLLSAAMMAALAVLLWWRLPAVPVPAVPPRWSALLVRCWACCAGTAVCASVGRWRCCCLLASTCSGRRRRCRCRRLRCSGPPRPSVRSAWPA